MPRLTRSVPKYRKHRASEQAVVTLNGRDFYLGPHGSQASKVEYDRLIGEWLAAGRLLSISAGDITVTEMLVRYWKHAQAYYGAGEQHAIRLALQPLRELYGQTPATDFGPLALLEILLAGCPTVGVRTRASFVRSGETGCAFRQTHLLAEPLRRQAAGFLNKETSDGEAAARPGEGSVLA